MKNEFLIELNRHLKRVPEQDRQDMLADFKEHFQLGEADGRTYKELAEELGNPREIAKDLIADYSITKAEEDQSFSNIFRAVFSAISLSLLNLIFVAGPALALFGIYLSLGITSISLILVTIPLIIPGLNIGLEGFFVRLFSAMVTGSLGVLSGFFLYYLGKVLYSWTLRYIKFNVKIIRGGKT